MRLAYRIALSAAVAIAVVLAGEAYTEIPVPKDCGSGGFGFSNSEYNASAPAGYGGTLSLSFAPGDSVTFAWQSAGNSSVSSVATLILLDPTGAPIYNQTGTSGSGSFTAGPGPQNDTYFFALPRPPPPETVDLNYQCRTGP